MKKIIKKYFFLAFAITMYSCNEDEKYDILERYIPETVTSDEIAPVLNLQAQYMDSNSETVLVTWMNPEDKFLSKVEISCCSANDNLLGEPVLLDAVSTKVGFYQTSFPVEERGYVKIVAINEKGVRSEARTAEILSSQQNFVYRADYLMSSVIELFLVGDIMHGMRIIPMLQVPIGMALQPFGDKVQLTLDLLQCIRSQRKPIMRN